MVVTTLRPRVALLSRGWSHRYPGDKALALTPRGVPLVLHVVNMVRRALSSPRVILYTSMEDKCAEYKRIVNVECRHDPPEAREKGPGTLIKTLLQELGTPLLVLPVDLPLLGVEALRFLIDNGKGYYGNCARTLVTADDVQALVQYHPKAPEQRVLNLLERLPRSTRATDLLRASHCLELLTLDPRYWKQLCHLQTLKGYKCPRGNSWRSPSRSLPTLSLLIDRVSGNVRETLEYEARMWRGLGVALFEKHSREDAKLASKARLH